MKSIEVFARNVKRQLGQKRMRIKDLAELVEVSDSYLSLVLSGARDNLNDMYKDRIAAALGTSVSQLYSESPPSLLSDPDHLLSLENGDGLWGRKCEMDTLEDWMACAGLPQERRVSVYRAFGRLKDEGAHLVASFLSDVVRGWSEEADPGSQYLALDGAESLPDSLKRALAAAVVLGEGCHTSEVAGILDVDEAEVVSSLGQMETWCQLNIDGEGLVVNFPSPSIRRSLYRRISADMRKEFHHKAALRLEQFGKTTWQEQGERATHLWHAGQMESALLTMEEAGDGAFREHFYRSALTFYGQALALARATKTAAVVADIGYKLSLTCGQLEQWDQAIEHAEQARLRFAAHADTESEIICLNLLASLYSRAYQLEDSLAALEKALVLNERARDEQLRCRLLHNQAVIQMLQGNWDAAQEQMYQALLSAERQVHEHLVADIMLSVGWLKLEQRDMDAALTRLHRALALARDAGNERLMGRCQYYLGHTWLAKGQTQKAIKAFKESKRLAQEVNDLRFALRSGVELAWLDEGTLPATIEDVRGAVRQLGEMRDYDGLIRALAVLSRLFLGSYNTQEGLAAIGRAVELAEHRGHWRGLVLAVQEYVDICTLRGDEERVTIFSRRLKQLLKDEGRVYPSM